MGAARAMAADEARILLAALLLDLLFGDPPNRWHPVAWMGRLIGALRRRAPQDAPLVQLAFGGFITVGGSLLVGLLAVLVVRASRKLPDPLCWLGQAWLLKTAFSLRNLDAAVREVETALRANDLPEARRLLSWHLVSRDTTRLNTAQIVGAAISSVAENTSDGIIAPLLWYAVGGIPAALIYRYINTGDAMLGYRDAEREWLGKIPARADDLFNLIPARLTALLFVLLRPGGWRVWRLNARQTASPNAGHPMSAAAGALGVELEKVGYYTLNSGACPPAPEDIRRMRGLLFGAVGIFSVVLLLILRGIKRQPSPS